MNRPKHTVFDFANIGCKRGVSGVMFGFFHSFGFGSQAAIRDEAATIRMARAHLVAVKCMIVLICFSI